MPKIYAAGDPLPAADYNQVSKVAGVYAADAEASDTYVITVSPVPTTYADGDVYRFKANTVNTGPATLNVNTLGATSILRADGSALAGGDIAAGQVVEVIYINSNFRLLSPVANAPKFSNGVTTKNLADADGTQTIAHGLGRAPRKVKMTVVTAVAGGALDINFAIYAYDGTNHSSIYAKDNGGSTGTAGNSTTIIIGSADNSGELITGTVSFDATNISIAWVKTATPVGTAQILWEAEA